MKAISRAGKIIFASLIFFIAIFIGNENVFAATTVSDFAGLKSAIKNASDGETINVKNNITLDDTLVIDGKNITISGSGTISADSALENVDTRKNTLFYIKGSNVTFKGLTLDGAKMNRIIYSEGIKISETETKYSNITLESAKIINGCPGDNSNINPGGGVFLRGGSLTATDTDFIGNTPGTNDTLQQGDGDKNGGAIYSGSTKADIKIIGGKFEDNEVKAYGHGAAIYQENGSLTVTGTSFKNNKGHVEGGNAGTQGACIHTRDKVTATISGVNAEIAKGFNTGGFLRSWKSDVTVTNSTFTIAGLGDGYGYSGGALCFENGTSKVTGSTFTCTGSKLYHAGGFIDIVGGGEHKIDNNTMTGAGKENGQQIASFGGAISVEESANATVTITNNTIKNTSASDTGGAIAIGTHKGKSTPSTVTMSGNTISNAGTLFWGGQYGGGVFVGPDATVTMTKDTMSDTRSSYGGGIYNEGNLTITGGSSLTGGVGSKLGGEIYNNGELIVDDATITGNFVGGAAWQQYASHGKNFELGGTNIYAEKDVTITPKANIKTGKDVRVLDGQSKILLTGPLTKEIDVSASEIAGGSETQKRRVGYVVAEGKDGYAASYDDANFLHYIGRTNAEDPNHYSNQPRAAFADDKSTGEWDFVLNPKTKQVVLGQRVKLTLYANGKTETPAKFDGVTVGRNEEEGILTKLDTEDTKEDTYDIYTDGGKSAILAPEPIRKGYAFTGWYKEAEVNDDAADENKSGKTKVDNQKLVEGIGEITSIIDPHEHELYAGWEKVVKVKKIWEDNNDEFSNRPDNIKVKLYSGSTLVGREIELNAENNWEGEFRNIRRPKIVREYTVKEFPGQVTGYKTGEVTGNDIDGFTVTNETEYITIEGSKTWEHGENPEEKQPKSVKITLSDGTKEESKTVGANDNWTWTFKNLPKYKNKTLVTYTLTEAPVDHYTSTKSDDGYSFTNTFTNKYKVTYEFKSGTEGKTLPDAIKEQFLPEPETGKENGAKVTPSNPKGTTYEDTENEGTWTFQSWEPAEQTIEGKDVKFVGTWKFTEKTSDFTITKTVDKATYEKAGDVLTYTVVVTNTGEKKLENLVLTDSLVTITDNTFTLDVKESKEFTYTYKVTEDDVTAKKVTNTAKVKLGDKEKEAKATSNLVEKKSDFTITKTVDKTTYEKAGDVLTYTVVVTNTGEKKLENLVLTDSLVTITDNTFTLDVKESKEFTYTYKVTEDDVTAKKVTNTAKVKLGDKEKEAKATSNLVEKKSDFTITKTVDKTTYEKAGDVLTYTVVVTNTGEKDLTGLTISDDKTTFENPTFDLSLKEKTKTFTYTYTVTDADVTAKSVKNIASVNDGKTTKTSSTTSNLVEKTSDFTITKTVDKTTYEKAGDVLTYKVTVTNTGEKKLENLVLTDSLVTITDNTFTLDGKESKEFTYTYTVTDADVTAKKVTNTATATLDKDSKTASTTSTLKEDKPKPPVTNIITEYVDIYGNELIPSKDGDQPVEVIPGYEFIETRRTEKVVSHIYKKIEREDPNPWFPLFPRVERKEKVETISVNAVVPEKTLLNKEDHKAYMFGYPDWTFLPNNNMTRAEVTTMFARLLKNYPSTNVKYNLPYSDVFEGDWYYPAVGFMTENNIIKGYEDGTFRPNAPITRAEFATIASKFDEILGGDVKGFYDVPASHWALKYINSAYERGWVTGYEDGSFRPDRNITRAEVVTVTNKMLIRYADVDYVRAHRDLLINFKDLDESHWAYFNIMEATHGHDFMRKANGKDETWERLNGEAFIFPDLRYEER